MAKTKMLPFFDTYRGESLLDLVTLEGRYRIDSLIVGLCAALERRTGSQFTHAELTILAVNDLETRVNGDGYGSLFFNSPEYLTEYVSALARIGCPIVADLTRRAYEAVGIRTPEDLVGFEPDVDAILDNEELNDLDQEFYAYPEPIETRLWEFIKANTELISL